MENIKELYTEDEIITLEFDDGEELECGIMGVFEVDGNSYIALDTMRDGDVYLYRYVENEEGFDLVDIPDEEFERVSMEFDRLVDEEI